MEKKEILTQKQQRKMNLRDVTKYLITQHSYIKPKKFIEYDQQEEEKQIQSKSRRWWQKVNKKYFKPITKQQLLCLQNTIMEDYYIMTDLTPYRQQSYFSKNLLSKNPRLFDKNSVKVLFQNNMGNDGYGDSAFVTYTFGIKKQKQYDEDQCYEYVYGEMDENGGKYENGNEQKCENGNGQVNKFQWETISVSQCGEDTLFQGDLSVTYMKEQSPQLNQTICTKRITSTQQITLLTKTLQLNYAKSSTDLDFLTQCNYFDLTKYQYYHSEIDREVDLWMAELKKIELLNRDAWGQVWCNFQEEMGSQSNGAERKIVLGEDINQQVNSIQQALTWKHNLVNIRMGFADKNQEMLAQALQGMWIKQHKTKNMGQKKKFFKASLENLMQTKSELSNIFQTDCKICFSTYVSEKNKVIYCDNCNQSFHEKCYGIQDLNEDPNSKFYCDACQYVMESGNKKSQLSTVCQLCTVPFSPVKKIGSSFFHPSCLFLNSLLRPKLGNLEILNETSPQTIVTKVKQFQRQNEQNECQYCTQTCKTGLRVKCSQPQCNQHFHSLCAYLNGCAFDIWRNNDKLQTKIKCWQHYTKRDHVRQTYLRRFFCNYKNIADLSENQFIQIYSEEMAAVKEYKQQLMQSNTKIVTQNNKKSNDKSNGDSKSLVKPKKKRNTKQQSSCSNSSIIDLNADQDLQNISHQNNFTRIPGYEHNVNTKMYTQKQVKSQQLLVDINQLEKDFIQVNKNTLHNAIQSQTLSKIQSFISTIQMNQNSDFDELKEDFPFLTESNTNSNDDDNFSKKIILQE